MELFLLKHIEPLLRIRHTQKHTEESSTPVGRKYPIAQIIAFLNSRETIKGAAADLPIIGLEEKYTLK